MIVDIFIYLFGFILALIAKMLPEWVIWPQAVFDGLHYFVSYMAKLNFILPIDTFFAGLIFLVNFLMYYIPAVIIIMAVNWFRGSGELKV